MIYEHASDYSWARAKCTDDCGLTVTAELEDHEAQPLRAWWRPFRRARLRAQLRGQMLTEIRRLGCTHVPSS